MRKITIPDNVNTTADVVVIGGGIVGVSTAYWLSKSGLDAVLVEAKDGLGELTTGASAECFRCQFTEPAIVPLAKESVDFFENFPERIGLPGHEIHLHQQGYLFITEKEAMLPGLQAAIQEQHRLGIPDSEFLPADEIKKRFPFLAPSVVGATFRNGDGWLSVHELVQGFAKASTAKFFVRTKVIDVLTDKGAISGVRTDRGTISTRNVVNAAGPFAGVIGKMAGVDLPLESVLRQKAFIVSDRIPKEAPFTVNLDNGSYWRPEAGGALIGWVNPDEPASDPLENPVGDWDFPAMALDKVRELTPFWDDIIENLKAGDISVSAGQYVYTPDQQPIIGPVTEVPGFHINCGYWIGVMISPAVGRLCADLVTGARDNKDNPLRLSRYKEGAVDKGSSFLSGH